MPPSSDQEIRLLRTSFWSARDPSGRAFAPLAEAFRQQGNLDEAESLLAEGLARHPTFTTALLVAARVARDRGDLALSRVHLDRLIHLDGGNVLALRDRAEARLVEGDREGALRDLGEAARLEPWTDDIERRLEEVETARAFVAPPTEERHVEEPHFEPDPVDRPILTRTMGDIYARQGFLARALEVYEHLRAENPDDEELRARLEELKGGGATERDVVGAEPYLEEGPAPEAEPAFEVQPPFQATPAAGPSRPPRAPAPGSRTIAAYFEDLLAWVPGAVPIASLAPGAPMSESTSGPDEGLESSGLERSDPERDSGKPKDESDDFHRWLEGLGT